MSHATRQDGRRSGSAFTLVELILVMALLATLMALVAPALSRSMRGRTLDGEAERLLALNEYGRNEAASLGVPTVVWVDVPGRRYGVDAKTGYPADGMHRKEFNLHPDVSFNAVENVQSTQSTPGTTIAEYQPDGTLEPASGTGTVGLVDRFKGAVSLVRTTDGGSYEIVRGETAR